MEDVNEVFDDFKAAEKTVEVESIVANTIVAKELTEVEQYKEEVLDEILGMSENPKDELTQLVVGYIQAMGDVDQVNICSYDNGNGVALDGWGFNGDEDLVSIDLPQFGLSSHAFRDIAFRVIGHSSFPKASGLL